MNCDLTYIGEVDGRHTHRCGRCGKLVRSIGADPKRVKRACGVNRQQNIPPDAMEKIQERANERGMLAGDVIAEITKAFGILPCGRCEKTREWLNNVHRWLRGD